MNGLNAEQGNPDTLGSDQRDICQYLASCGEQWITEAEIAKRAGGKKKAAEDRGWAIRLLPDLVERGIVESDANGHYRLRSAKKDNAPASRGREVRPAPVEHTAPRKPAVLFVDDDKDWRELVSTALQDSGHRVIAAKDGTEAMVLSEGLELRLMILDLDLGGESGLMLMTFLRQNHPGVPIILFTGLSHDDEQITAMVKKGATYYVRKGPLEDLQKAVEQALSAAAPKGS